MLDNWLLEFECNNNISSNHTYPSPLQSSEHFPPIQQRSSWLFAVDAVNGPAVQGHVDNGQGVSLHGPHLPALLLDNVSGGAVPTLHFIPLHHPFKTSFILTFLFLALSRGTRRAFSSSDILWCLWSLSPAEICTEYDLPSHGPVSPIVAISQSDLGHVLQCYIFVTFLWPLAFCILSQVRGYTLYENY